MQSTRYAMLYELFANTILLYYLDCRAHVRAKQVHKPYKIREVATGVVKGERSAVGVRP